MALAIELAAGRYPSLGVDGLLAGLPQRLRYLTADSGSGSGSGSVSGDRHRSLRDAIAWSYDLLSDADRSLLETTAVFTSWFDADAATTVIGEVTRTDVVDGLARLADHHLLVATPGQPTRYRALETIRQFADERLMGRGRADAVRERHLRWCTARLATLARQDHDDAWCARTSIGAADDGRAALMWAIDRRRDETACALAEQLGEQLVLRGQLAEAQRRYEQAALPRLVGPSGESGCCVSRPGWPQLGSPATTPCGCSTRRRSKRIASGDRPPAAACRAWMVVYVQHDAGHHRGAAQRDGRCPVAVAGPSRCRRRADRRSHVDVATASGLSESDPRSHDLAIRAVRRRPPARRTAGRERRARSALSRSTSRATTWLVQSSCSGAEAKSSTPCRWTPPPRTSSTTIC